MEDGEVIDINADVEYFYLGKGAEVEYVLGCCEGDLFLGM